jgi:hypothetical protein
MVDLLIVVPDQVLELPDVIGKVLDVSHARIFKNNILK